MANEIERDRGDYADDHVQPDMTPEINLVKGLGGPRVAAVIEYVQERWRRRRQLYSGAVEEHSGLGPGEISERIISDERLGDLFIAGAEASTRTSDESHICLLARVVTDAFTGSAKIDESEVRMQTLREMTSQQVQALAVLARLDAKRPDCDPDAMVRGGLHIEGDQPQRLTAATMELRRHFDVGHDMAEAITAALVRYGLIYNDPPGFADWGLTDYGRSIVEYLRNLDAGI